jgi:hypothetical protein
MGHFYWLGSMCAKKQKNYRVVWLLFSRLGYRDNYQKEKKKDPRRLRLFYLPCASCKKSFGIPVGWLRGQGGPAMVRCTINRTRQLP